MAKNTLFLIQISLRFDRRLIRWYSTISARYTDQTSSPWRTDAPYKILTILSVKKREILSDNVDR